MSQPSFPYPRRRVVRTGLRLLGRAAVPLLAKVKIRGLDLFPSQGPLIVVGNHSGAMEVVLMTIYSPRLIEFLGSIDIPHEPYIATVINAYGFIPVQRGNVSRAALRAGLDVLRQDGVLGIFPEGGIWEPAIRRAQTGVAWLSQRAQAPVLPIGFSSMRGAMNAMLRLRRPTLTMRVGGRLPPVQLDPHRPRKQQLQQAADQIVETIWALIPEQDHPGRIEIRDEVFELKTEIRGQGERRVAPPGELSTKHGPALSKFIHRTVLFNNLLQNLRLPIAALRDLHTEPPIADILRATGAILDYLEHDNPYYFTYRYGQAEGGDMARGVRELHALAQWAQTNDCQLKVRAIRRFTRVDTGGSVILDAPEESEKW
jgi:1-acyl-sn-glycerol-3-phosphate acyltransferase